MAPGISHSHFTHPIDSESPKCASRFEVLAPKLERRVTLFDPFHVRLWALLESNPPGAAPIDSVEVEKTLMSTLTGRAS
jgi:hypothetical protein